MPQSPPSSSNDPRDDSSSFISSTLSSSLFSRGKASTTPSSLATNASSSSRKPELLRIPAQDEYEPTPSASSSSSTHVSSTISPPHSHYPRPNMRMGGNLLGPGSLADTTPIQPQQTINTTPTNVSAKSTPSSSSNKPSTLNESSKGSSRSFPFFPRRSSSSRYISATPSPPSPSSEQPQSINPISSASQDSSRLPNIQEHPNTQQQQENSNNNPAVNSSENSHYADGTINSATTGNQNSNTITTDYSQSPPPPPNNNNNNNNNTHIDPNNTQNFLALINELQRLEETLSSILDNYQSGQSIGLLECTLEMARAINSTTSSQPIATVVPGTITLWNCPSLGNILKLGLHVTDNLIFNIAALTRRKQDLLLALYRLGASLYLIDSENLTHHPENGSAFGMASPVPTLGIFALGCQYQLIQESNNNNTSEASPNNSSLLFETMDTILNLITQNPSLKIFDQDGSFIAPILRGFSAKFSVPTFYFGYPSISYQEHVNNMIELSQNFPRFHFYCGKNFISSASVAATSSVIPEPKVAAATATTAGSPPSIRSTKSMKSTRSQRHPSDSRSNSSPKHRKSISSSSDKKSPNFNGFKAPFRVPSNPERPPISLSISIANKPQFSGTFGGYLFPQVDPSNKKLSSYSKTAYAITCAHVCLPTAQPYKGQKGAQDTEDQEEEEQDEEFNYPKVTIPSTFMVNVFFKVLAKERSKYRQGSMEYNAYSKALQEIEANYISSADDNSDQQDESSHIFGQVVWGERDVINNQLSDLVIIKCNDRINEYINRSMKPKPKFMSSEFVADLENQFQMSMEKETGEAQNFENSINLSEKTATPTDDASAASIMSSSASAVSATRNRVCMNYLGDDINFTEYDPALIFGNLEVKKIQQKLVPGMKIFKYGSTTKYTEGILNGPKIIYWSEGKLQSSEFVVASTSSLHQSHPDPVLSNNQQQATGKPPVNSSYMGSSGNAFAGGGDSGAWILHQTEDEKEGRCLSVLGMLHSYDGELKQFGLFTPMTTILDRLEEVTGTKWDIFPSEVQDDDEDDEDDIYSYDYEDDENDENDNEEYDD